jgi:hypothetical protein
MSAGTQAGAGGALALGFALLCALAMLPIIDQGADFENYAMYFDALRLGRWTAADEFRFEPLFFVSAVVLASLVPSNALVFVLLASLSLTGKLAVICRISPTRAATLLIALAYLIRFAPLHEFTQIRIALALCFFLLAFVQKSMLAAVACAVAAAMLHYSTIAAAPVLLVWRWVERNPTGFRRLEPLIWGAVLAIFPALSIAVDVLIDRLGAAFVAIAMYTVAGFGDTSVNLLSLSIAIDIVFLVTALVLPRRSIELRFWLLCVVSSVGIFVALHDLPVFAHRFRELFSIFWIFYLAEAMRGTYLQRLHAVMFVFTNVAAYAYLNFFGEWALFRL